MSVGIFVWFVVRQAELCIDSHRKVLTTKSVPNKPHLTKTAHLNQDERKALEKQMEWAIFGTGEVRKVRLSSAVTSPVSLPLILVFKAIVN